MYLEKFLARFVGLTVAGAVSAVQKLVLAKAGIRFAPWCGESFYFTSIIRGNMKTGKNGIIQSILLTFTLMVAAFWVNSAVAADKEMVKDPATGKMVLKPQHGGTITAALITLAIEHGDNWIWNGAGLFMGSTLDRLGLADWTIDRTVNSLVVYYPESALWATWRRAGRTRIL